VIHELTHSTMYGTFPIWFEEGFAHFLEYYLTESLDAAVKEHREFLRYIGLDGKLFVGPYKDGSVAGYLAERSQGFLFMKAVYDLKGIERLMPILAKVRTQTMGDQELLREFVGFGSSEEQRAMQDLFCKNVVGTARNYCR
jgi:hypothetical protein